MRRETKKNGETRRKTEKKWGDETQDKKIMGRGDARQKKWGDETRNKKNGETRRKTEKK